MTTINPYNERQRMQVKLECSFPAYLESLLAAFGVSEEVINKYKKEEE